MIYLRLFYEFMKIGLFAVGGGLATIPFLYDMAGRYSWFTASDITNMIAISESTPGPIGINMATYVGFTTAGVLGSIIATIGIMTPALIIVSIVSNVLERFKKSRLVEAAFYGIRPVVTAIITMAFMEIVKVTLVNWNAFMPGMNWAALVNYKAMALFAVMLFLVLKFKKHPVFYIVGGAVVGLLVKF